MKLDVSYFEEPGPANTDETLQCARSRAAELGIGHVVVATREGATALRAADVFQGTGVKLVAIAHQYGWKKPGEWLVKPEVQRELQAKGVVVGTSTLALSMPGRPFRSQSIWKPPAGEPFYGSPFPLDVMADTLRLFSQGMKVCVEIVIMAADMGLIPVDKEVIAIAGTGRGADTAVVIKPAHMPTLLELRIREILAMPR